MVVQRMSSNGAKALVPKGLKHLSIQAKLRFRFITAEIYIFKLCKAANSSSKYANLQMLIKQTNSRDGTISCGVSFQTLILHSYRKIMQIIELTVHPQKQ